ncbi:MAG: FlgO family outer membrane protein [Desulfurivibrio sp.]|nr:FlgO family outer membrane protein [Desulfurivibrio sp.]
MVRIKEKSRQCRFDDGRRLAITPWLLAALLLVSVGVAPVGAGNAAASEAEPSSTVTAEEGVALARWVSRIGEQLLASLEEPDLAFSPLRDGVMVLSFVEQRKLDRTTSFGRYLAEQLMNELQQHRVPVVELRTSREVRLRETGGEYGLSRDPAEIANQVAAAARLTGTYTVTAEQVMVTARIIDNRDSRLLASATAVIPRLEVVDELLSDPVSGQQPQRSEPMYMKRLDL